jgi:hypothetical protein
MSPAFAGTYFRPVSSIIRTYFGPSLVRVPGQHRGGSSRTNEILNDNERSFVEDLGGDECDQILENSVRLRCALFYFTAFSLVPAKVLREQFFSILQVLCFFFYIRPYVGRPSYKPSLNLFRFARPDKLCQRMDHPKSLACTGPRKSSRNGLRILGRLIGPCKHYVCFGVSDPGPGGPGAPGGPPEPSVGHPGDLRQTKSKRTRDLKELIKQ